MLDYCFCTLALGREYSNAALLLVNDAACYCPDVRFVVLTNQKELFHQKNADVDFFESNSPAGCYHDKRYVVSQALLRHDYCCYLDAECRFFSKPDDGIFIDAENSICAWNVEDILPKF